MSTAPTGRALVASLSIVALLSGFQSAQKPEEELAAVVKGYFALGLPADWEAIDKLPNFRWAPLPATSLKNCLPNGDCYARQGTATIGARKLVVVATGARTMVMTILLRNMTAPLGEGPVVAALKEAGLGGDLVRCPIKAGAGGTSWFRLKGATAAGFISIQPAGPGRPNEGFVITQGDELPALQPNQLASFTEKCAPGAERTPVSTSKPHQLLADAVVTLLAPSSGPALYDWKSLTATPTGINWFGEAPKPTDLTSQGDSNPVSMTGDVSFGGRKFSVLASGTPSQVKTIRLEEMGLHPKGEHMLGVVYEKGIAVRLVRCGPIYTESTNNWYSLSSAKTRLANVRQSIRYDGNQVQDAYELRLDGTLPTRDPRDRNPGTNGC